MLLRLLPTPISDIVEQVCQLSLSLCIRSLEASSGGIRFGRQLQVFPFKRLLAEESLFPWQGVGFFSPSKGVKGN